MMGSVSFSDECFEYILYYFHEQILSQIKDLQTEWQ